MSAFARSTIMKTIGHLNTRRFGMLLIAVLLAAGVGSITGRTPVAHANSIVVNSTADTIDSGDGTCTLREAIIQGFSSN
jgi:CSLREA domain-containing protein